MGKNALIAIGCALVIIIADYLLSNLSFPIFDESESLNWFGYLNHKNTALGLEDAVVVNTGVDKALVPVKDEFGDTVGYAPITDRKALLSLLEIAEKAAPRYIIMDIRFEDGYETEIDSALFAKICALPNIVISDHRSADDYAIADSLLLSRSAMSDYRTNMFSGFSRYEYIQNGRESVALKVHHDLSGHDIKQWGVLFVSEGRLSYNMQFIPLPSAAAYRLNEDGEILFPYLTAHVLGMHSEEELVKMMKDKILVIGDFDNDVHQTYVGDFPGPLLHYYAFRQLEQGKNKISYIYLLSLFIVYFFISWFLLSGTDCIEIIGKKFRVKSPVALFLLSLVGWGALLYAIKITLYFTLGISFIASIPAFVFSSIEFFRSLARVRQKNN